MELVFGILVILIYLSIFIFGYQKEYQRNPKKFIKTIIAVPLDFLLSMTGLVSFSKKIKKWVNQK